MKIENITCYLPIEIKARELDSRIYLALRLLEKGFSVVIGQKTGVNRNMFSQKKPFVYFDKGISRGDMSFYKAIKASNGLLVGIREEGIANNLNVNIEELAYMYNSQCAKLFSLIFIWGKRAERIINTNCPNLNKSNLIVSGHPSFDLLQEDLINYYYKLRELKYKIKPGYILINTNFVRNNGFLSFDRFKNFNYQNKDFFTDKLKKEYEEATTFEKKIFLEFLKMIRVLSNSFPEKNIVIRPHPIENSKAYEREFKEHGNIKVIKDGSAKEWIVGADTVIHHDCTTGIEAFFANKTVISYCPHSNENFIAKLTQDVSVKIYNLEDLISLIKSGSKNDELSKIERKNKKFLILDDRIANIETSATNEITKSIEKLCNDLDEPNYMQYKKTYYLAKFKLENFIERLKSKIQTKNKHSIDININQKSKFSHLYKEEIQERLNIWYDHFSIKKRFSINKLESNTFLLKNKS